MKKVMIVDHSSTTRDHLASIVRRQNHQVIAQASDGEEAIEKFKRYHPDLVIIDAILPRMNGFDTIKKLLELDPSAKIIICSAIGHKKFIMEMIMNGVKDYIVKPFLDEHIVMALEMQFQEASQSH